MKDVALAHPAVFTTFGRGPRDSSSMVFKPLVPSGMKGLWFCGDPGTGKSMKARDLCPNACLKAQHKWWGGHSGEDTVILDDCDTVNPGLLHPFKLWADRHAATGKTKGGTVPLQHDRFIITSNWLSHKITNSQLPDATDKCYPALERRFKQFQFKKEFVPPAAGEAGPGSWVKVQEPTVPERLEPFN